MLVVATEQKIRINEPEQPWALIKAECDDRDSIGCSSGRSAHDVEGWVGTTRFLRKLNDRRIPSSTASSPCQVLGEITQHEIASLAVAEAMR